MNSVLQREKSTTGKKQLSLARCVRMIRTTVKRQRTEEELAPLGIGELKLDSLYQDLAVHETVFYKKTEQQKVAVLKKFKNQQVKSQDVISQISGSDDCTTSNPLSVSAEQVESFAYLSKS